MKRWPEISISMIVAKVTLVSGPNFNSNIQMEVVQNNGMELISETPFLLMQYQKDVITQLISKTPCKHV